MKRIISIFCLMSVSLMSYAQDNSITFTQEQLKLPKKKGACFTLSSNPRKGHYTKNMARVIALNAGWNYSWGYNLAPNQPEDIEFVPMAWGRYNEEDLLSKMLPLVESGRIKRFLGFNEPDGKKQSDITVDQAIAMWPTLMKLGIPLGSPAPVHADKEWLEEFMHKVDSLNYRVDYICVHAYPGTSVENFAKRLTSIYNKFQKPLLITEFAPADWKAKTKEENRLKPENVLNFMKGILDWMEKTEFVYGYAWFSFEPNSPVGFPSALFDENGDLTELGKFYAAYEPNR